MKKDPQRVQLRSGWILLDASSASGGVHYHRVTTEASHPAGIDGRGEAKSWETRKEIDHVAMCKKVDGVSKRVDHLLRHHCSRTTFGYFADDAVLATVQAEMRKLAVECDLVNREAAREGCARRAYVAMVPAKIDLCHEDAAREIARTIQGKLGKMRELIKTGDISGAYERHLRLHVKNLPGLATGICAEAIQFAIDEVARVKKEIRERIKGGMTPASAGAQTETPAIDAAIELFAPLESQMTDLDAAMLPQDDSVPTVRSNGGAGPDRDD